MVRALLPALSTASRLCLPAISHYIYVGLAAIAISHLNSYMQPHHSPMASVPILTYPQVEPLCASNYPCPPGYRVPAGWWLTVGGVPVPPVPQGVARRAAITNHDYLELTPEIPTGNPTTARLGTPSSSIGVRGR